MSILKGMSIFKSLLSISIGTLCAYALALLFVNNVSDVIASYMPLIIGGFVASLVFSKSPWFTGSIIGLLMLIYVYWVLWKIAAADNFDPLPLIIENINYKVITGNLLFIPSGIAGAYLGAFVRRKLKKR